MYQPQFDPTYLNAFYPQGIPPRIDYTGGPAQTPQPPMDNTWGGRLPTQPMGTPSGAPGAWIPGTGGAGARPGPMPPMPPFAPPPRTSGPISGGGSYILPPGTPPWGIPGARSGGSYILPPGNYGGGKPSSVADIIQENQAAEEAIKAGQPTPRGGTPADIIRENQQAEAARKAGTGGVGVGSGWEPNPYQPIPGTHGVGSGYEPIPTQTGTGVGSGFEPNFISYPGPPNMNQPAPPTPPEFISYPGPPNTNQPAPNPTPPWKPLSGAGAQRRSYLR